MAAPLAIVLPSSNRTAPQLALHHLPCKIAHDGPARVSTFFMVSESAPGHLEAGFRGRRLLGTRTPLPAGTQGVRLVPAWTDDDAAMLQVTGHFDHVVQWQHDVHPNADSTVSRWLDYVPISRALHAAVDE